jgi:hypothetical protein
MVEFNGSKLADWELAECMRKSAAYFEEYGYGHMYQTLINHANEIDPPAIKCTHPTCESDAEYRLTAEPVIEFDLPGRIAFRCREHVWVWSIVELPNRKVSIDLV